MSLYVSKYALEGIYDCLYSGARSCTCTHSTAHTSPRLIIHSIINFSTTIILHYRPAIIPFFLNLLFAIPLFLLPPFFTLSPPPSLPLVHSSAIAHNKIMKNINHGEHNGSRMFLHMSYIAEQGGCERRKKL